MNANGDTSIRMSWLKQIGQRVRASEIERQLLYNRTRKIDTSAWLARFMPADVSQLLGEFLQTLLGAVIGVWLLTALLRYVFGADSTLTYAAFGLLFSLQATYYKVRLMRDPTFKIPKCRCAGQAHDNSEAVLGNRRSTVVGVPIPAVAAGLYGAIAALVLAGQALAAVGLSIAAVLFSTYLAYVMVAKIRDLCSTCISITAVNVLLAWTLI